MSVITVLPEYLPDDIFGGEEGHADPLPVTNPFSGVWWTQKTVSNVPESVMGWLVAQGWQIIGTVSDGSTVPPTISYNLNRLDMDPYLLLNHLCNSWTEEAHSAREANRLRYNDVIDDWKDMLNKTQEQFTNQVEAQNADLGLYITDLDDIVKEVDALYDDLRVGLALDYSAHKDVTRDLLTGLGDTDLERINEQFAATLATQTQQLIDSGLYTAAVLTDITARNERDRDEQIQLLNDRLNREKLENEHRLWDQNVQLDEFKSRMIAARLNTEVARLQGWKDVAGENQKLMAYQLDERNKLLIGLYSFVERREDVGPEWQDMTRMIAGLGDAAGGWITP